VNAAFETTLAEGIRFERRTSHATFATADEKVGMAASCRSGPRSPPAAEHTRRIRWPAMSAPERAWVSWSSGKDSAFALHVARQAGLAVVGLVTTVDAESGRVPVHGVPRHLVEAQARALQLPLHEIALPWPCPNDVYRERVRAALADVEINRIVFGDLFLRDIRTFREELLAGSGVAPGFPLWGRDTAALAADMVDAGLRAVVTAVDPAQAPGRLVGREFDSAFLRDLPAGVDPCGERGEFHTFVTDGPDFAAPVSVSVGEVMTRDGHVVAELHSDSGPG
jgi:uncharacterized protein (TIGR00290 family)